MDGSNFIFTADYPPDKVILDPVSGSFTAAARAFAFSPTRTVHIVTIPQPDDEILPDGAWSLNGSDWIPLGVDVAIVRDGSLYFQNYDVNVYIDGNTVRVVCSNWTASNQTIYYNIWGYSNE